MNGLVKINKTNTYNMSFSNNFVCNFWQYIKNRYQIDVKKSKSLYTYSIFINNEQINLKKSDKKYYIKPSREKKSQRFFYEIDDFFRFLSCTVIDLKNCYA